MQYLAPAMAFAITLLSVWLLTRGRLARIALDHPNARSLHQTPVPRTGGLGLHAGVVAAWLAWLTGGGVPAVVLWAFAAVLLISALDDLRNLPVLLRLSAHLIAAGAVCLALALAPLGWIMAGLLTLVIAWTANAFNFMDGSDGMAGGMAAIGFFAYGWAATDGAFAQANFCIAASALAFLLFNFSPAKIFMGDAGSVPLGFLAASLGLAGWAANHWPWWFPWVVFAPFLADATLTLLKRAMRGEPVWQAHREHAYQRLIRMGWSHRRLALTAYALMAACGVAALAALHAPASVQWGLVAMVVAAHSLLVWGVDRAWRNSAEVRA